MRSFFVYLGIVLVIVAGLLATACAVNPGTNTLVASGGIAPAYNFSSGIPSESVGIPFADPGTNGSSVSFTVQYYYGASNTTVEVFSCPGNLQTSECYAGVGAPLLTISGARGQGKFTGGAGVWYIAEASDPVQINVNIAPSTSSLAEEYGAIGAAVVGIVIFILGILLRDPLGRPSPRLAQLKRTLYFFFQSKLAVLGLSVLVFYIVVAILSPALAPYSPTVPSACSPPGCNGDAYTLPLYTAYNPWNGSAFPTGPTGETNDIQCVFPSYAVQYLPTGDCVPFAAGTISSPDANAQINLIPPTWTALPFNPGPVPLGSLATSETGGKYINIFTGLVRATPWDLGISAGIVLSGATIGLVLGTVAGYMGGLVDEVIMRLTDIFLSIPGFLLVIVIMSAVLASSAVPNTVNAHMTILIGAFVITWWPFYTRLIRGQVLVTREQKYVEAARASGARSGRILAKHIMPNSIFPMMVQISLDVGSIPLALGSIAFLGFTRLIFPFPNGIPFPEWGILSAYEVSLGSASGQNLFTTVLAPNTPFPWWELFWPGVALFMFAISVNFLSDGLRDALDPRLRR